MTNTVGLFPAAIMAALGTPPATLNLRRSKSTSGLSTAGGAFGTPGRGRNIWRSMRGQMRRTHGKALTARINPGLYPA